MLSVLQEKLAEAHGLALAASTLTMKVADRVEDGGLRLQLHDLRRDAEETRARCLEAERKFGPELAEELLAHANKTNERAADLAGAWFKAGTGPLAAWSFLAMGEAGEVAVWSALDVLAARAADRAVAELTAWALPIQRRHLEVALEGAVRLADSADPAAPRWG